MKIISDKNNNIITNRESNIQISKDFLSNFISSLSGKMFSFGLGLMLLDQTRSALSFGMNMLISPIIGLLFLVPIGNIVDKVNHKKILIYSMSLRMCALLVFAFAINRFPGAYKLIPVLLFLIIDSISVNFSDVCYSASIHELVNTNRIQKLSSLTQTATSISSILSPTLGIGLYSALGFKGFILIEISASILSFLIMLTMKFHYQKTRLTIKDYNEHGSNSPLKTFKMGLSYINKRALIKYIIIISVMLNFFYTALNIGPPFIIKNQLHGGNTPIGMFETGSAIGMLLGSLLMNFLPNTNKKRFAFKMFIPFFILDTQFILLGLLFLSTSNALFVSLFGSLIMGLVSFSLAVLNIIVQVRLQKTVPTELLGRVIATLTTANTSIMPLGILIFSFLFQNTESGGSIFIFSGLTLLLYTLIFFKSIRHAIRNDNKL